MVAARNPQSAARAPMKPPRRRRSPNKVANQPALVAEPEGDRPTTYKGVAILNEVPIEHLPGKPFRISRLFLENDEVVFACRDCLEVADTRGQIMAHRNAEHGSRIGKHGARHLYEPRKTAPDPIVPIRADGTRPTTPMEMTLGEFIAVAPSIAAMGDLIEKMEQERDAALAELNERTKHDRANQHKIDVYDSLRSEVVDLRLAVQRQGNYEQVKQEMYDLRAWKKKMITKLSALGFQLTEEDQ